MAKRNSSKKHKRRSKHLNIRNSFYIFLTSLILFFGWWVSGADNQKNHPKAQPIGNNSSLVSKDYNNLNLSLAAKAVYANTAITKDKDIGVLRGTAHSVISFSVPKDNLTEKAYMTLPLSSPPTNGYPVIILCHGYADPWSYSTEKSYLGDMEFYSQHGFAVIKPDYRGQGLSIPNGSAEGAYYSMAYNTDTLSLVAAIKKTDYLNKNKINLWGHSMGGYIALRAAVLSPDIKNVVLLSAPVGSIQDAFTAYVAISDTDNPTAAEIRANQLAEHGTPLSNPEFWNETSPINFISNTKAHIQIHVGTNDQIVPPLFSSQLRDALSHANKSYEYFVYRGGNHGLWAEREAIWQRSLSRLTAD